MKPRTQAFLALGVAVALFILAFTSGRRFRAQEDPDQRASTFVTGRAGVSGLYEAADRLGIAVERWRERPALFVLRARADTGAAATFVIIAPSRGVTPREERDVASLLASPRGGNVLVAGQTTDNLMACFGYSDEVTVFDSVRVAPHGAPVDSASAWVHARLQPLSDSARRAMAKQRGLLDGAGCERPVIRAVDTLLVTSRGEPVVLRLTAAGGRQALLVADATLLRNRKMRETSTGVVMLAAVQALGGRLVFDEYHHGHGSGGSMAGVALAWSARHPLGWMTWQLAIAGLLALLASGVRHGPVRAAIPRRRRSPLEHVRALATALAAADGHREAVAAMVRGLRRRLAATAVTSAPRDDWRPWLSSLVSNAPNRRVRECAERLQQVANDSQQAVPDTAVLGAAHAVEDVWQSLRP